MYMCTMTYMLVILGRQIITHFLMAFQTLLHPPPKVLSTSPIFLFKHLFSSFPLSIALLHSLPGLFFLLFLFGFSSQVLQFLQVIYTNLNIWNQKLNMVQNMQHLSLWIWIVPLNRIFSRYICLPYSSRFHCLYSYIIFHSSYV